MEPKLESTPRLRFTDDNNEPYPEWEEKRLGEVADWHNGYAFKPKDLNSINGYPVVKIKEMLNQNDITVFSDIESVPKANRITNGDLLFSWSMTIKTRLWKNSDAYLNQHLYKVIPSIDKMYLASFLNSEELKLSQLAHGGTAKHITRKELMKYPIPLPSLPEQEKIGEFLSSLDTEIEQAERLVSLLSDRKKAYAQRIFDRTLRFHDDNDNPYPKWEERKLGEVSEINPNGDIPESFEYIDLESVKNGSITLANTILKAEAPSRAKRLVNTNDILYSTVRPYQMNNVHIDESHNGSVASTGFAVLRVNGVAVSDFLYSVVNSDMFYSKIEKACVGGTYPTINNYDLGQTLVPLPSLPEQEKIGSFLSALDDEIEEAKRELELLKARKKAYAQKIFGV